MKKSRLIALFLTLAMMFSLCAAAAPEAEKDSLANSVKAAAQEVLSASAMNMWMYEENDVTKGTIQELAATPAALSAPLKKLGLSTEEVSAFAEDISFLREKTEYFKTMREEQDIRRNDFQLNYFFDEPEINGDRASIYVVESISFHYLEFPDVLSEATNYYNMELVWVDGRWLVAGITAEGDDFDEAYKGTGFTAANAEACFAAAAERAAEDEVDVYELAEEYGFTVVDETEAQAAVADVYYDYAPDNAANYAYTYTTSQYNGVIGNLSTEQAEDGRNYWNKNFESFPGSDCQNFVSQCIWAGFNGSNQKSQIYDTGTGKHSPIMDMVGNLKWYGTIPGGKYVTDYVTWRSVPDFYNYIVKEQATPKPDMEATISGITSNFSGFSTNYDELKGAALIHKDKSHVVIVTDVIGISLTQILVTGHTNDRKGISISDLYGEDGHPFYVVIPKRMRIDTAPEIKITADLLRPEPVGTMLSVGGETDQTCYSLTLNITGPDGSSLGTFTGYNITSNKKMLNLQSEGLYTITVTAKKTSTSDPVVYVYTIRAY